MWSKEMRRGFTLIEALVVTALIGSLVGLMLPALSGARDAARGAACASNVRQLALAWTMYAGDYKGMAMPLAYTDPRDTGGGDNIYWWGADGSQSGTLDHARGLLSPYLDATPGDTGPYACPAQRPGTYEHQGATAAPTSTYGYNGYYLSPAYTPGWSRDIGHRPHQRLDSITDPSNLMVFADTLLARGATPVSNALLDPPRLYAGRGRWRENGHPTTCFRHGGLGAGASCTAAHADGSVRGYRARPEWLTQPEHGIGAVGVHNDPRYIPDWRAWR